MSDMDILAAGIGVVMVIVTGWGWMIYTNLKVVSRKIDTLLARSE